MSQQESHPSAALNPEFVHHFTQLVELAHWSASRGGDSAMYQLMPNTTEQPGQYYSQHWRLTNAVRVVNSEAMESYSPEPGLAAPAWVNRDVTLHTRHYSRSEVIGNEPPKPLGRLVMDCADPWPRGEWSTSTFTNTRPATFGSICVRGCSKAGTYGDVALVADTYAEWAAPGKKEDINGGNNMLGSYSMARSLLIADRQGVSYSNASEYAEVLARLDRQNNPNHAAIYRAAVDALGRAVLNDGTLPLIRPGADLPTAAARDAAFVLDRHDALYDKWWIGYGIAAGSVFTVPGFLPLLHDKLARKEAEQALGEFKPVNSLSYVNTYVTRLVEAYARDETRDQPLLQKIKGFVTDPLGRVDLTKLITVGSVLAAEKNAAAAPGEELLPTYDKNDMRNVSDALLLILDRIRLPSADQAVRAAQFEQDMQHVEIIDILHMGLRRARSEAFRQRLDSA